MIDHGADATVVDDFCLYLAILHGRGNVSHARFFLWYVLQPRKVFLGEFRPGKFKSDDTKTTRTPKIPEKSSYCREKEKEISGKLYH